MMRALLGLLMFLMAGGMAQSPDYAAGQVWEYRTRPQDTGSLVRIQRVEQHPHLGEVFHISVVGVNVGGVVDNELQHLPVNRQTLDASLTRRSQSTRAFPSPEAGIEIWKNDEGGVFNIPISAIADIVDAQMPRAAPK